jgi:hypothetical protein
MHGMLLQNQSSTGSLAMGGSLKLFHEVQASAMSMPDRQRESDAALLHISGCRYAIIITYLRTSPSNQ